MDARNNPYIPLSSDNAALVLVDHQLGLLTGVRDIPLNNVVSLAKAMQILKVWVRCSKRISGARCCSLAAASLRLLLDPSAAPCLLSLRCSSSGRPSQY